nr:EAL domain-containing protein [Bauldia sp.]
EIVHSPDRLLFGTAILALGSSAAGLIVYLGLRILPLRLLHRAWERIAFLASHDELTRLPNRALFLDRLATAIAVATRKHQAITVHMLDLDGFKAVNDTFGHAAGDALLRQAAERRAGCLRQGDTLARLAGDEFAVIQDGTDRPEVATRLADRIIPEVGKPFDLAGQEAVIGVSIGMALRKPDGAATADDLLKQADLALYKSKASGRGTYHFYEDRMDADLQARMALEVDLRRALHDDALDLLYRPQVDLASGRITGLEVVARWTDPGRGDVPEAEFMRVAEGTGLVFPLNEWILTSACREALAWTPLRIAVNLSPAQFQGRGLVATVRDALSGSGMAPDRLELEITETVLLADPDRAFETLNGLKALGVRIVMDEFGVGTSSLGHLRRFPFDKIKIDRSFVGDIDRSHDARAVVRAIVGLSKALNMSVNADGVETAEQAHRLRSEGCHEIQGDLCGEPMTRTAIDEKIGRGGWLRESVPAVAAARPA